jgi:aspartate/tyrosine/aromatic aminotransferase
MRGGFERLLSRTEKEERSSGIYFQRAFIVTTKEVLVKTSFAVSPAFYTTRVGHSLLRSSVVDRYKLKAGSKT